VTLNDCPGHRDFVRNMVTGTVTSECAVLVVAAPAGEFEAGFSNDGQTKQHALLAFTFGVRDIIVCVNKMDAVGNSKERFDAVAREVGSFLHECGYAGDRVRIIPVSGWLGHNLVERPAEAMPWYQGPTLKAALDAVVLPARKPDAPLRFCVSHTFRVGGAVIPTGRIESGTLRVGDELVCAPSGQRARCVSVEVHRVASDSASHGAHIGARVEGITHEVVAKGSVFGRVDEANQPAACLSFRATIVVLEHPGEIAVGYTPVVDVGAAHAPCRLSSIERTVNRHSGATLIESPQTIGAGDSAVVVFTPLRPIVVEPYNDFPALGRIAVRDNLRVVCVGCVIDVTKGETMD
jgi:elongation factor 1-alpha